FMEEFFEGVGDRPCDAGFFIESALDDLQCAGLDVNRYAARRAARIADAVAMARHAPGVFVFEAGPGGADRAARAVVAGTAVRVVGRVMPGSSSSLLLMICSVLILI